MRKFESDYAVYVSPWNRIAAGLLAGMLLAVAIVAAWYGLVVVVNASKEILVSVVAAAASLLSAVFAYAFQRAKDVELAAIQKRRELELSERKTKQENYTRILDKLAPYIRSPAEAGDEFTTAYLHAWVIGSQDVVKHVHAFLDRKDSESLDLVLLAMRADLTLESDSKSDGLFDDNLRGIITSKNLFPEPAKKQGLK